MPTFILFIIASLIWGSTFWAITQQLGEVPPAVSIVYRFAISAFVLFVWCKVRGDKLTLPWRSHRWLMLQGFFTFSLSYLCTYSSEQYLVSAMVSVLFALMVIWSPIAERIFFASPLSPRIWIAAFISIVGVVLLFYPSLLEQWQLNKAHKNDPAQHFLWGLTLAFIATIASTLGNLAVVKVKQNGDNLFLNMAWAMFWGSVFVAIFVTMTGQAWILPTSGSYWASLLYLAIFGSVIAFACYFTLIHRIGVQKTVFIGVVTPIISVLLSIKLEAYRPGWIEWSGVVLCLLGVVWAIRDKKIPTKVLNDDLAPVKL
jgi:drug/metabolite transporter (DMT)-like permease